MKETDARVIIDCLLGETGSGTSKINPRSLQIRPLSNGLNPKIIFYVQHAAELAKERYVPINTKTRT